MVMQPACKSTTIAGQNLVLPWGLDLQGGPSGQGIRTQNGLIPVGGRWGMTLIGALYAKC